MAAVRRYRQRNLLRRNRIFRDRTNPFDTFSDDQLHQKFRFRRHIILNIVDEVAEEIQHPNRRGVSTSSVSVKTFEFDLFHYESVETVTVMCEIDLD